MKKWIAILIVVAAMGVGGYKFGINYLSDKMIDQVLSQSEVDKLLQDNDIQQAIREQIGEHGSEQSTGQGLANDSPATQDHSANDSAAKLSFSSKEEALSFLLTKFSMSELARFASKAQNGTAEEKKAIQAEMMSRLTPEELQALKIIGLTELSNRQ
ncbi:hypothetical protein BEP19_06920 [Ammoniphilus oxalaticus]|uniref:Uncharacterized protein n=1 Tax=Ammoniphilus oxalaticus TaxID=66863 RepID=A0A419SJE2_9BACL|nr:hypothetical protein [Ammoniphilus oxalaticus]RKD24133.1 hypothetical protein BEP19_06920 [Ammoniphilus oxalaticus]